jgi:hypothetical protein
MVFETLKVSRKGAVLFVEIAAPLMNLLGSELVRDLDARAGGFSDGHSVPIYSPCHRCLLHISERNW